MLFVFVIVTLIYCILMPFSWLNAVGYIKYPHDDNFEAMLYILGILTSAILIGIAGFSSFVFPGRDVTTNIRITEVAKVGNKVVVSHNGSEIAKVNIENVRVSRNDNDYVKVTDSQKTMNSKIMQDINGSKIGSHDKKYTVYLGNKKTLKDLGIKVHKSNK